MNAVLSAFLLTFAGLFPIVNPLEAAPFFLALTPSLSSTERNALARRVAINGFALLLGSMALGPWLLEFFGIELPVVRIAGGLVVTALGWKLLTEEEWSDHGDPDVERARQRKVGSFYPLTMPLTVGPGSISVAVTIGSKKPPDGFRSPSSRCMRSARSPGSSRSRPASTSLTASRQTLPGSWARPASRSWCGCRRSS